MLHNALSELLGVEFPVIQAGMGSFTSAQLVAAVSNAGGLGSLGAGATAFDDFREHLSMIPELTEAPFAVNHTILRLDEEAFRLTLKAKPAVVSFALGDPGHLVERVHDAGILVMHQVTTVEQALQAADLGVDVINAQGGEAGGFGGYTSTLVLVAQVVATVEGVPVVASGGIADGRGLAAALALGAAGVNVGTRFLASSEAPISAAWKNAIIEAASEDAVKVEVWNDIFPLEGNAYATSPRALRSSFIEQWMDRRDEAQRDAERLRAEIEHAVAEGRFGDLFPFTGESAGLIDDILPAAEIVRRMVEEAEHALERARQKVRNRAAKG